ncbi:chaplin, partial [Streptomyces virginiae]|uniref:chaplin n=1 Tax=Streptomyces virginiae TaxID=1961 RepID=UPI0035E13FAC
AERSPGLLSGNLVQLPVNIPVNACGNTVSVVPRPGHGRRHPVRSAAPCPRCGPGLLSVAPSLASAQVGAHPRTYSFPRLGTDTQPSRPAPPVLRAGAPPRHRRLGGGGAPVVSDCR